MVVHLASDLDPDEAQEWLDSVDALVAVHGPGRARQVFAACLRAYLKSDHMGTTTPPSPPSRS
jgi:pyruvate dehydrogenase complex dehydrogenase (E1) component